MHELGTGMASKLLLAVVFVIDLIAFGLAVAAEQRRATATTTTDTTDTTYYCVYKSDISTKYSVGSLLLLLFSQLLVMFASRCLCCGRALWPGRARVWAIILFISCWFAFIIAEVCLLAGSVRNAYHTKYRTLVSNHPPSCETLRKGVFGAGAAFVVFTGILSELYYVNYSKADDGFLPNMDTGIRMGAL